MRSRSRRRALTGFDTYAYAGYAKLPHLADAYRRRRCGWADRSAWSTTFGAYRWSPCYYGPLWVALSRAVAGGAQSLGSAIFAFRVVEVGAFLWVAVVLAAWRKDAMLVALFALNPAVHGMYVANAHNDLLAVALILSAVALARRFPLAAALAVAAAALIKVPFVAAALYVFAGRGALRTRIAWVVVDGKPRRGCVIGSSADMPTRPT